MTSTVSESWPAFPCAALKEIDWVESAILGGPLPGGAALMEKLT